MSVLTLVPRAALAVLCSSVLVVTTFGVASGADDAAPLLPLVVNGETIETGGVSPYGYFVTADVLANDRNPDGGTLRVCSYTNPDEESISVTPSDRYDGDTHSIFNVAPLVNETATYEFTYVACNDKYSGEGILTIDVYRIDPVEVRRLSPGRIQFTNPGTRRVDVYYGRGGSSRADGVLDLAGGVSQVVRVHRSTIKWDAYHFSYPAGAGRIEDTGAPDHSEVPRVRAKVVAPHQVRFANRSELRVEVSYGKAGAYGGFGKGPDDVLTLAPGASGTVRTRRDQLRYRCTVSYGLSLGHGIVDHVRDPARSSRDAPFG